MHCYKTFAATTLIANTLEIMPEIRRKLPYVAVADWMAQNSIEPDDVLYATPEEVKAKLTILIENCQPQVSRAA